MLENFPNYKSIVYNKLLIDSKRLLWYIYIYIYFLLNIIWALLCSYFFLIFLPNLSYDVLMKCVLIKKSVLVAIRCHSLSFVATRCHLLYHSLYHSFVIHCHAFSFVVTRCTTRLSFYKTEYNLTQPKI